MDFEHKALLFHFQKRLCKFFTTLFALHLFLMATQLFDAAHFVVIVVHISLLTATMDVGVQLRLLGVCMCFGFCSPE